MPSRVTVTLKQDRLQPFLDALREELPAVCDLAARKICFDVIADVAAAVPVDTGRLRAGWRLASAEVAGTGSGEDAAVEVEETAVGVTYTVENRVEYAAAIEYGSGNRPAGGQLAAAMESVRRKALFGSSGGSLRGLIRARIQEIAERAT